MTDQTKLVIAGGVAAIVTKFYFQKDWTLAISVGLGIISVYAILTANTADKTA